VTAWCMVSSQTRVTTELTLEGYVSLNGSDFTWTLTRVSTTPTPTLISVESLHIVGFELLSFHPVTPLQPSCFYRPDDNGVSPQCGGDSYYVDNQQWIGLDEWYSETWSSTIIQGTVDINTVPGPNIQCIHGSMSRFAAGPISALVAGGWSHSGRTGAGVYSSQNHAPFWAGLRSYENPGRCSVFTISSATLHTQFLCGSALPLTLRVGLFPAQQGTQSVSGVDVRRWLRKQYPLADSLYRTTMPFKLFLDGSAYTNGLRNRITFEDAKAYIANMSYIFDYYPITPILVGWQGLGHDTLYPSLDVVNENLGGAAGLLSLNEFLLDNAGKGSSLSYHVNTDEAYSHYNGTYNPEFDIGICRLNVDHKSAWYSNCSVTHEQSPDCGIRCSISKTRDAVTYGRYQRYARMFDVVPVQGLRTIHSDAWRDVGASWEPNHFISMESEQFCGQVGDSNFWKGHQGLSMGCEGQNGQAANMMGVVSYFYHGDGYHPTTWNRIISGSTLGFDEDVDCANPGAGKCGWNNFADSFYTQGKLYQLALTDDDYVDISTSSPTSWVIGGDRIPIIDNNGGYFLPLVQLDSSLSSTTMHAYQSSRSGTTAVTQQWTLPLSWVGSNVTAVTISPEGLRKDIPTVGVEGRSLKLIGVVPGWPVRVVRTG